VSALLAWARARQRELMTATCRITRTAGEALDEGTGQLITNVDEVYEGACRVLPVSLRGRNTADVADRSVSTTTYTVGIPVDEASVQIGDIVQVLTCADDPALAETRMRVRQVERGTHVTVRRLVCEEAS